MRRARPPPYYAHKGPEFDNMYRTQRLDSALVCAGVLRNSGRCVRNPGGWRGAPWIGLPTSPECLPLSGPNGLTSGCIIIEHLLVDDEDEGAEMRNTSEEAAGRSNITTGTWIIGLTAGCAVEVVCRENPGYFIRPPAFTFLLTNVRDLKMKQGCWSSCNMVLEKFWRTEPCLSVRKSETCND